MPATRDSRPFAERRVGGTALAILMIVGAATVVRTGNALKSARETLASTSPFVSRSLIQDRLIGTEVAATTVFSGTIGNGPAEDGEPPAAVLLWILDLDNCKDCLRTGINQWNALQRDPTLERHLVVSGDTTGLGTVRRALAGTNVRTAQADEIASVFGVLLPSTQLLIDGDRVIVMADSRTAASECGWSFAAQVGSLRGTLASDLLRN